MTNTPRKNLCFHPDFLHALGLFNGAWASLELMTSYGIGKFLKISFEEAHVLTSGMEFGRKATLLRNLVYRSDDQDKQAIINLIGKIQNESKRNVFAHSYIISNPERVTFIDRSRGGDYVATEHSFSLWEFAEHVGSFTKTAGTLERAIVKDMAELHDFAKAALRANTKPTK